MREKQDDSFSFGIHFGKTFMNKTVESQKRSKYTIVKEGQITDLTLLSH